ncbi:uncharacterized protein LOC144001461 isoform X2 [Festucalex cinctus]
MLTSAGPKFFLRMNMSTRGEGVEIQIQFGVMGMGRNTDMKMMKRVQPILAAGIEKKMNFSLIKRGAGIEKKTNFSLIKRGAGIEEKMGFSLIKRKKKKKKKKKKKSKLADLRCFFDTCTEDFHEEEEEFDHGSGDGV